MSTNISPLDQLIEEWGKLIGNIITSEEQRAIAPITTNNNLPSFGIGKRNDGFNNLFGK